MRSLSRSCLLALLLATSLALLVGCSGDNPDAALPAPYRTMEVPEKHLSSEAARADGRELYLALCAMCHGPRGDGKDAVMPLASDPRDFTDVRWNESTTPRRTFWVIQEGRQGTAMASFSYLDAGQTWDLVAYVLSIAEKGPLVEGVDEPDQPAQVAPTE